MGLDPKRIGEAITYLRKQAGFTQKGLADRLFISDKAVSKWERGLSVPDIAYLGKLSVLLDIDIDSLLEGKHESNEDRWKGFLITEECSSDISLLTVVYDKPLVYFLLSNFLLVGIREILIACTEQEEQHLRQILGDGKDIGIILRYTTKTSGTGLRKIMETNHHFFKGCHVMTVFGNAILYSVSLTYLYQRAMLNREQHTVISLPVVNPTSLIPIAFDEAKRVTKEDSVHTQYEHGCLPIMFSPGDLLIKDITDDASIKELIDLLREQEKLYAEKGNRGVIVASISNVDDAVNVATMIQLIQKYTGVQIACLEEIAWRRGFIDSEQLKTLGEYKQDTIYGKYILSLIA